MRRLIKRYPFYAANRSEVTLGTGARIDPQEVPGSLKLTVGYSEGIARTSVWNPKSVKQWLGFEAEAIHQYQGSASPGGGVAYDPVTSLGFRVSDGTDEYWWSGAAWEVNTTDWNTEVEISANLPTFPITAQKLQFVIHLVTTESWATPRVTALKVLWQSDVELLEDILYRSLVPLLRENVRPVAEYPINPGSGGPWSSLDLDDYPLETPYNLVDVIEAYDHTDDPEHLVNLRAGYDAGTKVVTFSSPIPDGNRIWLRFTYEPEVAVTTSADYNEVSKVPALLLQDTDIVDASTRAVDDHIVVDKSTGAAVKLPAPTQGALEVTMDVLTDKAVDAKRMADAIKAFFANHPTVTSAALDQPYTLWLISEYDQRTPLGQSDLHQGQVRFRVRDIVFYVRDSVDSKGVLRFLMTGTEDFTIAES